MTMTTLGWLGMAAYAMHILEEYTLDWRGWSRAVLGLPTEWNDFYVTRSFLAWADYGSPAFPARQHRNFLDCVEEWDCWHR
jgi:hypothetical protein